MMQINEVKKRVNQTNSQLFQTLKCSQTTFKTQTGSQISAQRAKPIKAVYSNQSFSQNKSAVLGTSEVKPVRMPDQIKSIFKTQAFQKNMIANDTSYQTKNQGYTPTSNFDSEISKIQSLKQIQNVSPQDLKVINKLNQNFSSQNNFQSKNNFGIDSQFGLKEIGAKLGNQQKEAQMTQEQISFKIDQNTSGQIQENFQDIQFSAALGLPKKSGYGFSAKQETRRTRSMQLCAIPKSAEGHWGDVKRHFIVGGNWKSNGTKDFVSTFPKDVLAKAQYDSSQMEVCVAPTDIHLTSLISTLGDHKINVMAQDVSQYGRGAYTGNITADQLKDIGVHWTLTGHSERRTLFHESDKDVALKTKIALENGMKVMACIGEKLEERESGKTLEVCARQLKAIADHVEVAHWGNIVVAYEPVWAIGTGKVASPEQAQETHHQIRDWMSKNISPEVAAATRILYGGSVSASNCGDLIKQKDIDGFLVGGASLKPEFKDIIETTWGHFQSQ